MIAETLVACTREHRVIRNLVLNPEAAEPAIGKVDLNSRQSGVVICTPWNGGGAEFIYKGD